MRWAAVLLSWLLRPGARRFRAALADPRAAQARVQAQLLAGAQATLYGRDFRTWDQVPVTDWATMAPWVARQRAEGGAVLVADPVRFYERTSGSTGVAKDIPYTSRLLGAFSTLFSIWAEDLLASGPRFSTGRLYFSVSPRFGGAEAHEAGTTDDRDFLTGWVGAALRPFWLTVPGLAAAPDATTFWRTLAHALAAERRLEVISVWSPSFLRVLLDWMVAHRDELPRAALVGDWTRLWPELKLVSCWASGASARGAAQLAAEFPGVLVQGKGLLATEAPVTVPILGVGPVPLLTTTGVELAVGDRVVGLADADVGQEYEVLVSQPAGLLRYRLGDRVRVTGRIAETPLLELLGRPSVSDLVGEKLGEGAVEAAIAAVGLPGARFVALVPAVDHYVLVLDRAVPGLDGLAAALDQELQTGFHYRRARALGQLAEVRVVVVPDAAARELAQGPVWGATKPRLLRTDNQGFEPWT